MEGNALIPAIVIKSRYNEKRYVKLVDQNLGIFCVSGSSAYFRFGDGLFDFDGGPCYMVGDSFEDMGTITGVYPILPDENIPSTNRDGMVMVTVKLNAAVKKNIKNGRGIQMPVNKPSNNMTKADADLNNFLFTQGRMK